MGTKLLKPVHKTSSLSNLFESLSFACLSFKRSLSQLYMVIMVVMDMNSHSPQPTSPVKTTRVGIGEGYVRQK